MIKRVFYNASFPRSGSTLLQNILGQNPILYTSPTSGMFTMLLEARRIFTNHVLFQSQNHNKILPGISSFFKGGIEGYYNGLTDKPYAIDKFRGWLGEYDFINAYDAKPKIVCMVRDLRSVYSSFEKKYRENPLKDHQMTDYYYPTGQSVMTRINGLSEAPVMSIPTESLWQMIMQGNDKNIHFMKFEEFAKFPTETMEELYSYLELPNFEHDFDNIEQLTAENDQIIGGFADHNIRNTFSPPKEDYNKILGEYACNHIVEKYKWFYDYFNYLN